MFKYVKETDNVMSQSQQVDEVSQLLHSTQHQLTRYTSLRNDQVGSQVLQFSSQTFILETLKFSQNFGYLIIRIWSVLSLNLLNLNSEYLV